MNADQSNASSQTSVSPRSQTSEDVASNQATILVRGEAIREQEPKFGTKETSQKDTDGLPRKEVSETNSKLLSRLPALDDDGDIGLEKEHIVIRDGAADLAFTGKLLASAAPDSAPKGQWNEYRIYETSGGKRVFSKVTRSVSAEQQDTHAAEIFDPAPSSVPSKLLRSARDLAHTRPLTWADAAVEFFGYDPLAKVLYRKFGGQFEEHIG